MTAPSLEVDLAGLRLRNPTILASGVLGVLSPALLSRAQEGGAAAVVTKTVTPEPREGYDNPVAVDLGFGYVNAMGIPNPGAEEAARELAGVVGSLRIPVIAGVGGSSARDLGEVVSALVGAGPDAFEVNASCPHVRGMGASLLDDPREFSDAVSAAAGAAGGRPVFVKLPPGDQVEAAGRALDAGASGLTAVNTVRAMVIDVYARVPVLSAGFGGLSGPAIRPAAVAAVYSLSEAYPDVPLVGVGGVETWRDAAEMMLAGASAVGVGSAVARRGIGVFGEIARGLAAYLESEGFSSVSELVGAAHRR